MYGKLKLDLLELQHQVSEVQRVVVAENRLEDKVSTLGQEDGGCLVSVLRVLGGEGRV